MNTILDDRNETELKQLIEFNDNAIQNMADYIKVMEATKANVWTELDTSYGTHDYFEDIPSCKAVKVEVYEVSDESSLVLAGECEVEIEAVMNKYGKDITIPKNISYEDYNIPITIECKSSVHEMADGNYSGNVNRIMGTMPSAGNWYMMAYYR